MFFWDLKRKVHTLKRGGGQKRPPLPAAVKKISNSGKQNLGACISTIWFSVSGLFKPLYCDFIMFLNQQLVFLEISYCVSWFCRFSSVKEKETYLAPLEILTNATKYSYKYFPRECFIQLGSVPTRKSFSWA